MRDSHTERKRDNTSFQFSRNLCFIVHDNLILTSLSSREILKNILQKTNLFRVVICIVLVI